MVRKSLESEDVVFLSEGLELKGVIREVLDSQPKAVVICHGAYEDQGNWTSYAEKISSEGYTTFTFDFAGHGKSQGIGAQVNMPIWAYNLRDALNFMGTRGYHRFALVGWGSGGTAVILACAHDPRLACSVVLSSPILLVPTISDRMAYGIASIAAHVKKYFWKSPLTLSRLNEIEEMHLLVDEDANKEYLSNPDVREIYRAVPVLESLDSVWIDITNAIGKINTPVMIIHGAKDEIIPKSQSYKLYTRLQSTKELHIIEESGHALHLDQKKDEVYKLILRWIKRYLN